MKCMILFTEIIYKDVIGMGEKKNPKENGNERKNTRLVTIPLPFYDIKVDCFSESENKPDLP